MRDEYIVSDASESATAKERSEVCRASDAHFRPFNAGCEFARLKNASSVSDSRRLASPKKGAGVEFTLGTQLFLQQFLHVVTLFPQPKKFAAPSATPLESEPNQTPEPTAPSGRGSS